MKHKPSPEYNAARDAYGNLDKGLKDWVLDRVSQLTSAHSGPEAEAAFVRAMHEVTQAQTGQGWPY